jgi:hypothetical protein
MGQACAVIIIQARRKDLRFSFEAAKCCTMNYPVAVPLEIRPIGMRLFSEYPAPAGFFADGIGGKLSAHIIFLPQSKQKYF